MAEFSELVGATASSSLHCNRASTGGRGNGHRIASVITRRVRLYAQRRPGTAGSGEWETALGAVLAE